ncbi:hypothetical protein Naga_100824g3 [Nannochloropsis gaditana]|uniref:Uncharacterized protein n=1 Tax=Nannochloropsis gaditana TaxID=72520 RepID=W7TJN3_9STRA|nr:hypothetical protein Naga_100824g3 [Nannochloropsis gaditana]
MEPMSSQGEVCVMGNDWVCGKALRGLIFLPCFLPPSRLPVPPSSCSRCEHTAFKPTAERKEEGAKNFVQAELCERIPKNARAEGRRGKGGEHGDGGSRGGGGGG